MKPYRMRFLILLVSLSVMLLITSETLAQPLTEGFYKNSCPSAERIVKDVAMKKITADPGLAAGLLRLMFHDCFVRGCDASLLLTTIGNNISEQEAPPNVGTLRGFAIIDEAKAKIEAACPKTVSCADILSFATRDGVKIVGGISYNVPAGRRDGVISSMEDVDIPSPDSDLKTLTKAFTDRGLSVTEMVALFGAHSIGVAQCKFFTDRLYPQDPFLDPAYATILKKLCPKKGQGAGFANLDLVTPNRLDNQFYRNLNKHRVLFTVDQVLLGSPVTSRIVRKYMNNSNIWAQDFGAAMIHLSSVGVLTGKEGEIRVKCGSKNRS